MCVWDEGVDEQLKKTLLCSCVGVCFGVCFGDVLCIGDVRAKGCEVGGGGVCEVDRVELEGGRVVKVYRDCVCVGCSCIENRIHGSRRPHANRRLVIANAFLHSVRQVCYGPLLPGDTDDR